VELHLIIVIILLLLAVIDLTVGVANDAVNFLNSALGSRAATFRVAMIVAALGVMVGVTFSSGMMEIARSGIFNPQYFFLTELLIIFVALMFQDILLLDLFNTFGLPTSTTVSLVFGLLGAAVGVAIIKVVQSENDLTHVVNYINTDSVLVIISAILLSILFAFAFGYVIQYLTRLLFTYSYKPNFRKFGSVWSGLALTSLSLFILIKGAKGASFIPPDVSTWIQSNQLVLSAYMFVGWTMLMQLLMWFTKVNVLKVIVLIGTFALAMAFAANDLVNFIGAPIAGLHAYQYSLDHADVANMTMGIMSEPVKVDTALLLLAGIIMVITLFVSRKARNVSNTTIGLGSQEDSIEKFESNLIARNIVRLFISIGNVFKFITPNFVNKWIQSRFDLSKYQPELDENGIPPAFDLLRAAVILMVSAGLISIATSMKLPLSTTYVTFIVAMAAALSDKSWGRESAVYRVSGVVTVIGGWFLTALSAFVMAGIISSIIFFGELYAIFGFVGLIAFTFFRTGKFRKDKDLKDEALLSMISYTNEATSILIKNTFNNIANNIGKLKKIMNLSYSGLLASNLKNLKISKVEAEEHDANSQVLIKNILKQLYKNKESEISEVYNFSKSLITLQDLADRVVLLTKQNHKYIDNNHHKFTPEQTAEIGGLIKGLNKLIDGSLKYLDTFDLSIMKELEMQHALNEAEMKKLSKIQYFRIKESSGQYKKSMLYLNILSDVDFIGDKVLYIVKSAATLNEKIKKYQ
jgi:phosphate/sulfate permease